MKQILIVTFLLFGLVAGNQLKAQSKSGNKKPVSQQPASDNEALTNATVIALSKAGVQKSVIIATINNSESNFDTSANGILNLKKQGISDEIIAAIANKGNSNTVPRAAAKKEEPTASGSALSKLEPGIYYAEGNVANYAQLEASVFSQSKMGSGILTGLTYGIAKTKAKAVLSGAHSNMEVKSSQPVFYFIFPKGNSGGLGNESNQTLWYSNATSPNEFILIRFKSIDTKKTKGREVVTGSFSSYTGFSGGVADENKVLFRFTKVSSGIYKVYFENPVEEGEYAFIFAGQSAATAGGAPSQKAFDFSITK